ncbi:MAG: bifunctional precorrin-2 dehydrogenase/sirohydrochlorin ferrochelatase [Dehalococcoidia bacterium]|nr:bifunctional precorrin-2 dehydrogenase/sirohydrochlorin ferrochelatase [Dehalococcoidia bacterium]
MSYYPLFLEMKGRRCLVVGGGLVAQRKVEGLLAAEATVTVVSPELTPEMASLRDGQRIEHRAREYRRGDLEGFSIVVAATDDAAVNTRVAREARQKGTWVNVVDEPEQCDFILPSVIRRGDVVLAISTGGLSPALARWLREELEGYLSEDFDRLARLLAETRRELRESGVSPDAEAWQRAIDGRLRELLSAGRYAEAKARLLSILKAGPKLQA